MTLEELIEKLIEAKEHCVNPKSKVKVYEDKIRLNYNASLLGEVYDVDFDNSGANIYIIES